MKQGKFIILRVILDVVFTFLLYKAYQSGEPGIINLKTVAPTIVVVFIVAIAAQTIGSQGLVRSVCDAAVCIAMYYGYLYAVKDQMDLLYAPFGFISILRGLVGVGAAIVMFDGFRKIIIYYLKAAQIYCLSQENEIGLIGSIFGSIGRFKYTLVVPLFNRLVRKTFKEVFAYVKDNTDGTPAGVGAKNETEQDLADEVVDAVAGTDAVDTLQGIPQLISAIKSTPLAKLSGQMVDIYMNYLDECVLAYCYRNPKESMAKSAVSAIGIAVCHSPKIITKIVVSSVLNIIARIIFWIVCIAIIYKTRDFRIATLLSDFIIVKGAQFILEDCILEPLLMGGVVKVFCTFEAVEGFNPIETLKGLAPSILKLDRLKA